MRKRDPCCYGLEMNLHAARRTGFVDLDGARLAWTRSGRSSARPSVLLAHGLTDSAACWGRVTTRLAESFDVVCYDARGHGASDGAASYSFELHTSDLIGLSRALGLDRPVLVGHSMGGAHAAVAAVELGARALIVEDPHWPEIAEDGTKDIAASRRSVIDVAALPEGERWTHGRAAHPEWADVDLRAWVQAQPELDPNVVTWFNSWPTTNKWRDHVSKLSCPGLLLNGSHTTVTRNAAAQAKQRWPQLEVVQIDGAGHNVRRDRFEPYWRAVTAFLDAL